MSDFSDFLDTALNLDDAHVLAGEAAGTVAGHDKASGDGFKLGVMKAWEVGMEMGWLSETAGGLLERLGDEGEFEWLGGEKRGRMMTTCGTIVAIVEETMGILKETAGGLRGDDDEGQPDVLHKLQLCRTKLRIVCSAVKLQGMAIKEVLKEEEGGVGGEKSQAERLVGLAASGESDW